MRIILQDYSDYSDYSDYTDYTDYTNYTDYTDSNTVLESLYHHSRVIIRIIRIIWIVRVRGLTKLAIGAVGNRL